MGAAVIPGFRRKLRSDLVYAARHIYWYLYGLLVRFIKQFLLAVALFLGTGLLVPEGWGPLLSVTLPFVVAFAPFGFVAYRWYRQLRWEEAHAEVDRREREHAQLLELARRHGVPAEVFIASEEPPEKAPVSAPQS
jgi:hypothetical protein